MPKTPGMPASGTPGGGQPANVTITSNVQGADIEIDGAYVGSTPTTRPLASGTHKIKVSSGQRVWERNLQVDGGGSITVNANLSK